MISHMQSSMNDNPFITNTNKNTINENIQYANDNVFKTNDIYHHLSAGTWIESENIKVSDYLKMKTGKERIKAGANITSLIVFIMFFGFFIMFFLSNILSSIKTDETGLSWMALLLFTIVIASIIIPMIMQLINKKKQQDEQNMFNLDNAVVINAHKLMQSCNFNHELMYKQPYITETSSHGRTTKTLHSFNIDNIITKPVSERKWYIIYARIRNYCNQPYGYYITSNIIIETENNKARLLIPDNADIMQSIIDYMGFNGKEDTISYYKNISDTGNAYLNDSLDVIKDDFNYNDDMEA